MPRLLKSKQQVFRPAAPDELQIDLDRPRARIPKRLLRLVEEHCPIISIHYGKSKSGNTHVLIRVKPFTHWPLNNSCPTCRDEQKRWPFERLMLQAALGSDPVRELLSWGRARNGCPYPTLFFEEKKK